MYCKQSNMNNAKPLGYKKVSFSKICEFEIQLVRDFELMGKEREQQEN